MIQEERETSIVNLTGVDIDPNMVKKIRQLGIPGARGNVSVYCVKCDCCMAFDVLEHIDDINNTLYNWSKHSKHMIIQVPAKRQPKFKFKGHFHVFTEKSFKTLISKYGEIVYYYVSDKEQLSKGPAQLAIVKCY